MQVVRALDNERQGVVPLQILFVKGAGVPSLQTEHNPFNFITIEIFT